MPSSKAASLSDLYTHEVSHSTPSSQHGTSFSAYSNEGVSIPSSSQSQQQKQKKIPRPPNAWILYRSAKVKEKDVETPRPWPDYDMPTPSSSTSFPVASSSKTVWPAKEDSGTDAVRLQSMMSRKVADMWKAESEEVKKQYHELAKRKKEEHERMYPGYKYKPAEKTRKVRLETDDARKEKVVKNLPAKRPRASTMVEGERPASTAKTKGKGPPDLYIDVDAAEKETPFNTIMDLSFSAVTGQTSSGDIRPSYFGVDALDEATAVVDGLLEQPALKEECLTTDGLATGPWMASPLPLTPAEGEQVVGDESTITEPWTAWIMDKPVSADPTTPISNRDHSTLTAPLTEPPKGKKGKKDGTAKDVSRVRNTARRKSTSSAGVKQKATSSLAKTGSAKCAVPSSGTASLQRKLKKAAIHPDYAKSAKKAAAEREPISKTDDVNNLPLHAPVEHTMNSDANTLEMLLQSYDRDGVDSEVEEALLCADTLIESFASMAAWSPDQGWFTGLPYTAPLPSQLIQNAMTTEGGSSWALYSQPTQEGQAWDDMQMFDTEMIDRLRSDVEEKPLMPQILSASSFAPPAELDDDVVMAASRRLAEWVLQADNNQVTNLDIPLHMTKEEWTLNEQEWDALLVQAIIDPSFNQAAEQEQRTTVTTSSALDTPPESVWDLIHLDSLSQARSVDAKSYCGESVRSATSPVQHHHSTATKETPVIELHGSYTEEELREKLRQLTGGAAAAA